MVEDNSEIRAKYRARRMTRKDPVKIQYSGRNTEQIEDEPLPEGVVVNKYSGFGTVPITKKCLNCKKPFTVKPDKFGQYRKVYCGTKCLKAAGLSRLKLKKSTGKEFIKEVARAIYCPELNMSFYSVKKTSEFLKLSMRKIYGVLDGTRPDANGLTFVDYDHRIHAAPRHQPLWEKLSSYKR